MLSRCFRQKATSHPGYGWLAVFSGFCVMLIQDGIRFSFGALLVEIVEEFDQGRAVIGAVVSITFAFSGMLGPLAGALADLYGSRIIVITGAIISSAGFFLSTFATNVYHLWITFGMIGGIGFGMMYLPTIVCVLQNFKQHRSLASGIVASGSGVGVFTANRVIGPLIDHYGWRGTILLGAGFALHGVVVGLFLVRTAPDAHTKPVDESHPKQYSTVSGTDQNSVFTIDSNIEENSISNVIDEHCSNSGSAANDGDKISNTVKEFNLTKVCKSMCDFILVKDARYFLVLSAIFTFALGYTIPFTFIPDQVIESGLTKQEAGWLTSSIGISGTMSRIGFGILGDRPFVNRLILLVVIMMLNGILTGLSPLLVTMVTKTIYCCLFGALSGGFASILPVVLTDVFGDKMFSKFYGIVLASFGLGVASGTPIGGYIFDVSDSYNITFIIAGTELFLGGLLFLLSKYFGGKGTKDATRDKIQLIGFTKLVPADMI